MRPMLCAWSSWACASLPEMCSPLAIRWASGVRNWPTAPSCAKIPRAWPLARKRIELALVEGAGRGVDRLPVSVGRCLVRLELLPGIQCVETLGKLVRHIRRVHQPVDQRPRGGDIDVAAHQPVPTLAPGLK